MWGRGLFERMCAHAERPPSLLDSSGSIHFALFINDLVVAITVLKNCLLTNVSIEDYWVSLNMAPNKYYYTGSGKWMS